MSSIHGLNPSPLPWPLLRGYHGQTALMNLSRFYPILDTPSLAARGVEVFGVNPQSARSHVKFRQKFHFPFPLGP